MYFLDQIKNQFLYTLAAFQVGNLGEQAGTPVVEETEKSQISLTDAEKARLENLEQLEKDLEAGKGGENYLSKASAVISGFIERVAKGEVPGYSKEDPEYLQLKSKLQSYEKAYHEVYEENIQIAHILEFAWQEVKGEITEHKDSISEDTVDTELLQESSPEETINTEVADAENALFEAQQKLAEQKIAFETKVTELGDSATKEQYQEVVTEFGVKNIQEWIAELQDQNISNTSPEGEKKIADFQKVLASQESRSFENMTELQSITEQDFRKKVSHNERLTYFTKDGITSDTVESGTKLDITFMYNGVSNRDLSTLTAGQIVPENVSTVEVAGTTYIRKGLKGEFFPEDANSDATRLMIYEGDTLTIGEIRSEESLTTLNTEVQEKIKDIPEAHKDIAQEFVEKGLPIPTEQDFKMIQDTTPALGEGNRSAIIEGLATDISEMSGSSDISSEIEELKKHGILGAILAHVLEYIRGGGALQDENGIPVSPDTYFSGMGISPEEAAEFGETGGQLAHWLSVNRPVYEGTPYYCGKNVGEALNHFGFKGLPTSGRNGADWATICAQRPSQFQKLDKYTAENAPPGALISYKRNTGGSAPRIAHGHVEIALGGGRYYFGTIAEKGPGGSRKNPPRDTYDIYMPISKNPKVA